MAIVGLILKSVRNLGALQRPPPIAGLVGSARGQWHAAWSSGDHTPWCELPVGICVLHAALPDALANKPESTELNDAGFDLIIPKRGNMEFPTVRILTVLRCFTAVPPEEVAER